MSERCTKCSAILSDVDNKDLISEFLEDLNDVPDSKWTRRHKEKWEKYEG